MQTQQAATKSTVKKAPQNAIQTQQAAKKT
jgi:hypothetical protein